ncbi:MAG: hypothetical protein WA869_01455 [Alloacidobacterium sp.]|jgi:hypothetical protein
MQVDLSNLDVILSGTGVPGVRDFRMPGWEAFEERAVKEPVMRLSKRSAFPFRLETI